MSDLEMKAPLRDRIDEISTRLLLLDPANQVLDWLQWAAEIKTLKQLADVSGFEELSANAGRILSLLENGKETVDAVVLHEGLAELQKVLSKADAASRQGAEQPTTNISYSIAQDPELIQDFVLESREHLASVEAQLLKLEKDPMDLDAIHSVFRSFHTIKGVAGFLDYFEIRSLAHEVETILNQARDGLLHVTPPVIDVILASVDHLNRALDSVETRCSDAIEGLPELLERVRNLDASKEIGRASTTLPESEQEQVFQTVDDWHSPQVVSKASEVSGYEAQKALQSDSEAALRSTQPGSETCSDAPSLPVSSSDVPATGAKPEEKETAKKNADAFWIRVDTSKLDYLMDMVGEMVIAQSLVRHHEAVAGATDPRWQRDLAQLARITGEVQRTAMAMRMIPISQLFGRVARQVRDLSRKAGKQVELVTRGGETEFDKTIAEALGDPLMHMVRNAIDHGIEGPERRSELGKPVPAKVTLAAFHRGGQIVIEVGDDGKGLDASKILAKAQAQGLVDPAAHLSDSEVFRLIFEPGLSTADKVTDISGRGVGMDVVRKQIEKLRGRIEIQSEVNVGTTFLLKLPLTLAIVSGLVVGVGKTRYIVPLFAIREMFRPSPDVIFSLQGRGRMAMVRDRLLPIVPLHDRFRIKAQTDDPCEALLIVVESEGQQPFCLMVDELIGQQEVVVKSLGDVLGHVRGIAGGAILGDGRVGLIIDVGGLWEGHEGN
jgi:two-component system, chemotaxis family, sensor kinase CheA